MSETVIITCDMCGRTIAKGAAFHHFEESKYVNTESENVNVLYEGKIEDICEECARKILLALHHEIIRDKQEHDRKVLGIEVQPYKETNYIHYFGSPARVDATFNRACRDCSTACKRAGEPCPCEDCNVFFIEGFAAGHERVEWLNKSYEDWMRELNEL